MSDEQTEHKKKQNWFKRHKKLSITAAIVVVIFVFASVNANNDNKTVNTASTSNTTSTTSSSGSSSIPLTTSSSTTGSSTPGLNQPADDGKFQFTVTGLSCGQTELQNDNEFENATAQGQFCVLKLAIKDISTVSQEFDASAQYVYTSDGTQYSYNSNAMIAANPSSSSCFSYPTINPGVTQDCNVAFDVPKGTTPTYAMLHDSSLSNGVKVNLQ